MQQLLSIAKNNSAGDEDWLRVTKGMLITSYSPCPTSSQEDSAIFTQNDFHSALQKVSKRRSKPIGENVRDAIDSIKGKQD